MFNLDKALELTIKARNDIAAISELEQMIKNAISEDVNRGKGTLKNFTTIRKMIRKATKDKPERVLLHGVWEQNGRQYYTNAYCLIELYTPMSGLPPVEEEVTLKPSDFFKENNYAQSTTIDAICKHRIKIQLKHAKAEVKAMKLKSVLSCTSGLYKIGESYYNVELLNDVISVIGSDELTALFKYEPNTPCILKSDKGRVFICPVFRKEPNNDAVDEL